LSLTDTDPELKVFEEEDDDDREERADDADEECECEEVSDEEDSTEEELDTGALLPTSSECPSHVTEDNRHNPVK